MACHNGMIQGMCRTLTGQPLQAHMPTRICCISYTSFSDVLHKLSLTSRMGQGHQVDGKQKVSALTNHWLLQRVHAAEYCGLPQHVNASKNHA
jgi:hypothetical protein